jgi:hypothetical protein
METRVAALVGCSLPTTLDQSRSLYWCTDRNDNTTGVAKGDEPETLYMVASGQHYNAGCCFDVRCRILPFSNAEPC